ncbi:MAG: hypothetical protein UX02_C0002G0005 [Candidatus Moranbacteria bacterium GW2011_GWC1_45_18]|nr:MAG: hypothetical protein UW19_C0019G0034 [Candidatus Moranbacteria bacterium GW2011_GWF2_44_10]KKT99686.1 MAG: hypothetical protein UX02_C0002G0005 [Candidatus Moranbacteria bacterium GW2011_GWC1_45_18]HBB36509.1 hypothetical protein [Candidatus Moranbacteria bacterium]HBU25275.1 hypothetical protein [Candidatus Moranbacteria bacterium]
MNMDQNKDFPKTNKQQIRQRIIATLIVAFMFMMISGSINTRNAMANDVTNLIQNFVAGTHSLEASAAVAFSDISLGSGGTNSLGNLIIVNARDYTGTGSGWSVTGSMNDMYTSGSGGLNIVVNSVIAWNPQTATLYGLEGAGTSGIAKGTAQYFSAIRTLVNAGSGYGLGNYRLNGTEMNIVWDGAANQVAGTYQNTLTLTIAP